MSDIGSFSGLGDRVARQIPWTKTQMGVGGDDDDLLATMFEKQKQHMIDYAAKAESETMIGPHEYGDLGLRIIHEKAREFAGYTVEELYEAVNHLKAKPWKETFDDPDRDAMLEELADTWHFFIELHIILGITPEEVFQAYFRKAFINDDRKTNGY